jgi:hypothetical protein
MMPRVEMTAKHRPGRPAMQAQDFVRKWQAGAAANELNERACAQAHFIDLCRVLGVPEPADPEAYCFERGVAKTGSAAISPGNTRRRARAWKVRCAS